MQQTFLILIFVILVCARSASRHKNLLRWLAELTTAQKIFAALGFILAVLILCNPEFLCLGLLADTTFFDLFVLALSLQLHSIASHAVQWFGSHLLKIVSPLSTPSPGLRQLFVLSSYICAAAFCLKRRIQARNLY